MNNKFIWLITITIVTVMSIFMVGNYLHSEQELVELKQKLKEADTKIYYQEKLYINNIKKLADSLYQSDTAIGGKSETIIIDTSDTYELVNNAYKLDEMNIALEEFLNERQSYYKILPNIWPVLNEVRIVTSGFGLRRDPFDWSRIIFHYGIDISSKENSPIIATAKGEVIKVNYNKTYGRYIEIDHGHGITTLYAHLNRSVNVKVGDIVSKGQVIGSLGNTGSSTGYHNHYEIKKNGIPIPPEYFLPSI